MDFGLVQIAYVVGKHKRNARAIIFENLVAVESCESSFEYLDLCLRSDVLRHFITVLQGRKMRLITGTLAGVQSFLTLLSCRECLIRFRSEKWI